MCNRPYSSSVVMLYFNLMERKEFSVETFAFALKAVDTNSRTLMCVGIYLLGPMLPQLKIPQHETSLSWKHQVSSNRNLGLSTYLD
jgi:hypothetical protein